jgi:hypothetical protein
VPTELQVLVNLGAIESQHGDNEVATRAPAAGGDDRVRARARVARRARPPQPRLRRDDRRQPAEALDAYAAAEDGYRLTGSQAELPRLHADHALALADANLLDDAEHLIDRAVATSAASGNDLELAELLLVSAEIDLAKGKVDEARTSAANAVAAFTRQGRDSWLHVGRAAAPARRGGLTPDAPENRGGARVNGRP